MHQRSWLFPIAVRLMILVATGLILVIAFAAIDSSWTSNSIRGAYSSTGINPCTIVDGSSNQDGFVFEVEAPDGSKEWRYWTEETGYVILGWVYENKNDTLSFVVNVTVPHPITKEDFEMIVWSTRLDTLEYAERFDRLIKGYFQTFDLDDRTTTEWIYWTPDGSILLGWTSKNADGTIDYKLYQNAPITEARFREYVNADVEPVG